MKPHATKEIREAAFQIALRYGFGATIISRMLEVDHNVVIHRDTIRKWIKVKANRKARRLAARAESDWSTAAKSAATARTGATSARPAPSA